MILVNGDSFTFGDGLTENESAWPTLLFNSYNNIAQSGSSNPSIFRRSIEELYLNSYSQLVVAWSGLYRFEWADNYAQPKTFLINQGYDNNSDSANIITKELLLYWHNEFWYLKQFLILLSNLRLHCKNLGVEFYFLNTSPDLANCYSDITYNDFNIFVKLFDPLFHSEEKIKQEYKFLQLLKEQTADCWIVPPTQSIQQFYEGNTISKFDTHPNQLGHQLIADQLSSLFKLKTA